MAKINEIISGLSQSVIHLGSPAGTAIEALCIQQTKQGITHEPKEIETTDAFLWVFYDEYDEDTIIIHRKWNDK